MEIAGSQEITIRATPEAIWQMISDVTRTSEWSPDVIRSEWVPPATGPAVGAPFDSVNRMPLVRRWHSRSTVTEAEPGRRFAFAVGTNPDDPNTTWTWDLEPVAAGTRVRLSYQMRHEPWIVLVYYRVTGRSDRVRRSVQQTLERLRRAAGQSDEGASSS